MENPEHTTPVNGQDYMLPALLLTGLGYYISFEIAEQPEMPNVILLKLIGFATMAFFGSVFVLGIKQFFTTPTKADAYKEKNY